MLVRKGIEGDSGNYNESNESSDDSDSTEVTDSEEENEQEHSDEDQDHNMSGTSENEIDDQEEEEDEVIKAIKRENERQRDHPPPINCEEYISDLSFHPTNDLLAVASVVGDVLLYKYSKEENTLVNTLELHTKACRDIEFDEDGKILYSVSKDKSIMLTDVESGKLIRFYDDAHECPIYCVYVIQENLFATGDDNGSIKLWDTRQRQSDSAIFSIKKNEDYISDIITNEAKKFLVCSSGDGSLTTIDLQNRKLYVQSEEYEEELTCLGLLRNETKFVSGSSKGKLFLYNWNEFGLHCDEFAGPKCAINSLVPITENIVVAACDDGNLRATHLFPNRHLGIVGQHNMSVERVDICNNGTFIASASDANDIKFWNIQYFEEFDKLSNKHKKHQKSKEMMNHLPSSKRQNVADFFSEL